MDPKATRIEAIGIELFGKTGWKPRLADALDITRQHVGAMMSGDRRITREVEDKVADLIRREVPRREAGLLALRGHLADIEREHIAEVRKPDHQRRIHVHEEVYEIRRAAYGRSGHWTEIGDEIGIPRDRLAALHLGEEPWTRELSDIWRSYMVTTVSQHVGYAVNLEEARAGFRLPKAAPEQPSI